MVATKRLKCGDLRQLAERLWKGGRTPRFMIWKISSRIAVAVSVQAE